MIIHENIIAQWRDKPAYEIGKRLLCADGEVRFIRATSSIYGRGSFDLICDGNYGIVVHFK